MIMLRGVAVVVCIFAATRSEEIKRPVKFQMDSSCIVLVLSFILTTSSPGVRSRFLGGATDNISIGYTTVPHVDHGGYQHLERIMSGPAFHLDSPQTSSSTSSEDENYQSLASIQDLSAGNQQKLSASAQQQDHVGAGEDEFSPLSAGIAAGSRGTVEASPSSSTANVQLTLSEFSRMQEEVLGLKRDNLQLHGQLEKVRAVGPQDGGAGGRASRPQDGSGGLFGGAGGPGGVLHPTEEERLVNNETQPAGPAPARKKFMANLAAMRRKFPGRMGGSSAEQQQQQLSTMESGPPLPRPSGGLRPHSNSADREVFLLQENDELRAQLLSLQEAFEEALVMYEQHIARGGGAGAGSGADSDHEMEDGVDSPEGRPVRRRKVPPAPLDVEDEDVDLLAVLSSQSLEGRNGPPSPNERIRLKTEIEKQRERADGLEVRLRRAESAVKSEDDHQHASLQEEFLVLKKKLQDAEMAAEVATERARLAKETARTTDKRARAADERAGENLRNAVLLEEKLQTAESERKKAEEELVDQKKKNQERVEELGRKVRAAEEQREKGAEEVREIKERNAMVEEAFARAEGELSSVRAQLIGTEERERYLQEREQDLLKVVAEQNENEVGNR